MNIRYKLKHKYMDINVLDFHELKLECQECGILN